MPRIDIDLLNIIILTRCEDPECPHSKIHRHTFWAYIEVYPPLCPECDQPLDVYDSFLEEV